MANPTDPTWPPDPAAYRGRYGIVAFAPTLNGDHPAKAEWDEQRASTRWQASFMSLFDAICQNERLTLFNRQKFKQVEGDLFEFKQNSLKSRIFAFRYRTVWYLLRVFTGKKEDELPQSEVDLAKRRMEEAKQVLQRRQRSQK